MTYGEWIERRDRMALDRMRDDLHKGYHSAGEALTQMAGIKYHPALSEEKVEEAMSILREQNPLGGPWISLVQDYQRMRQAEKALNS